MKKILVPVDLSGNAESAVLYSADLAKTMPAKVYLFHSIILPEFYVTELNDYALYQKELNSKVDKIYDQSISLLHGMRKEYFADTLRVNCKVLPAKNIYNGILDYADELNPDLILLGEGEKLDKIRIGANAERVLRLTDLPVLVVKRNSKISKRKKSNFRFRFFG
ncbi:MAG: universal stress protein [Ignavibacteria bacterium]|nr:universal stress protein [Ignavibacteria bacterium]